MLHITKRLKTLTQKVVNYVRDQGKFDKGVGASTAAITVNNTDGTCTANITNNLSNRRLTINGDMRIAQRGTSSTGTGYQTVDRFQTGTSGVDETPTQAQADVAAGTTPYTLGFRKSFKVTNGNQTSGAGASDVVDIKHVFEAQDIANSGWNYLSSSSFITLSLWVKSSVAQNFFGHVKHLMELYIIILFLLVLYQQILGQR